MKVAEILLNPMGEDDDDFELNYVIDKNFYIGMTIVDSKDIELTENDEIPDKIGEDCLPFYRKDCEEDAIKNRALVGSTKNTMPNQGVMDKVEENSIQVVDDNWRDYNENHSDTSSILEGSQEDFADDLAA
ncbi:Bestrophin homolog [Caenorhabditis elegans]|nr:Bestrophin homolog [Caenorhabditis elegans]CZR14430.1 Bestrophin homolog [Caenorhabditis elegans]|eukprot:NP_001309517.1 Bestrophin homolog [Caenorhabditis elegans]